MVTRKGGSNFPSLLDSCVLWAPLQHSAGVSGDIDEFPIIPSGVTVTNNGTFTKSSLGNNKSVLNFDGLTNYISLTDNDAWNIWNGDFTIAGWIYPKNSTAINFIFGQISADTTQYWDARITVNTGAVVIMGVNAGTERFRYGSTVSFSLNTWYHFVYQRSGTACLIYINGVPQTVATVTVWNGTLDVTAPLRIGEFNTQYANCNFKDLMIFKGRVLTQPEIKLLMNRTHPITGAGLIDTGRYWRLTS